MCSKFGNLLAMSNLFQFKLDQGVDWGTSVLLHLNSCCIRNVGRSISFSSFVKTSSGPNSY